MDQVDLAETVERIPYSEQKPFMPVSLSPLRTDVSIDWIRIPQIETRRRAGIQWYGSLIGRFFSVSLLKRFFTFALE